MTITVTSRGYDSQNSSAADLTFSAFTPAAGSVLLAVIGGGGTLTVNGISGHTGGAAWVQIAAVNGWSTANRDFALWACFVGASPSSAAVAIDINYADLIMAELFELTGVDTSGSVANAFGVTGYESGYDTSPWVATLAAFANAANMTFSAAIQLDTTPTFTWEGGRTTSTTRQQSTWALQCAWHHTEDNSVSLTTESGKHCIHFAFEIKAASGGGSQALEGAATAGATASAAATVTKPIAGAGTAGATASGALGVAKPLAGAATAGAQASAGLTHGVTLAGAALVAGTAAGAISVAIPLAGVAVVSSVATGAVSLTVTLSGAAIASALATAGLNGGAALTGAAIGGASASAALSLDVRLAGAATAGAAGSSTVSLSVPLSGAAIAAALATGSMTVTVRLTGAATGGASAAGTLLGGVTLAGNAIAGATASAALPDAAFMGVDKYRVTATRRMLARTAARRRNAVAASRNYRVTA